MVQRILSVAFALGLSGCAAPTLALTEHGAGLRAESQPIVVVSCESMEGGRLEPCPRVPSCLGIEIFTDAAYRSATADNRAEVRRRRAVLRVILERSFGTAAVGPFEDLKAHLFEKVCALWTLRESASISSVAAIDEGSWLCNVVRESVSRLTAAGQLKPVTCKG
jgi:hypothetical protein